MAWQPAAANHHVPQCTPLKVVIFDIVLFGRKPEQICEQYKQYTTKRYGCARAVFDGYDAPSTKNAEHSRRVASSREVLIEDNVQLSMTLSQREFLGNTANKVRFIALLTYHLEDADDEVYHAYADRLIV